MYRLFWGTSHVPCKRTRVHQLFPAASYKCQLDQGICYCLFSVSFILFFKDLFLEKGKGGRKRGRETSVCGCLSRVPYGGPGPQPRRVSWPGIQPATLWLAGQCSVHWATPAGAGVCIFLSLLATYLLFSVEKGMLTFLTMTEDLFISF